MAAPIRASLLIAGLIYSGLTSFGGELPDRVLPDGVGVNIHFTRGHERDLDLIAAADEYANHHAAGHLRVDLPSDNDGLARPAY